MMNNNGVNRGGGDGNGKKKRKKRKKKKKNTNEPAAPAPVVMGFLRRSNSPVTSSVALPKSEFSPTSPVFVPKRTIQSKIDSKKISPPFVPKSTSSSTTNANNSNNSPSVSSTKPQSQLFLKLIQSRKASNKSPPVGFNNIQLNKSSPPATLATNNPTKSSPPAPVAVALTPPPAALPTVSRQEIDTRLNELRRLVQEVITGGGTSMNQVEQLLQEELQLQFNHQDDILREEAVCVVHDCLKQAAAKRGNSEDALKSRQKTFHVLDLIIPTSLRSADDVSIKAKEAHVRVLRQATAMSLLHQRPVNWSNAVSVPNTVSNTASDTETDSSSTGIDRYWYDRRMKACEYLGQWNVDGDDISSSGLSSGSSGSSGSESILNGSSIKNEVFMKLFDGRMEQNVRRGTSLVVQLMHRKHPMKRTTKQLLEYDAMSQCSRWLCSHKFKSHWGNAIKTFEEIESNLQLMTSNENDNKKDNKKLYLDASKRTLRLIECMEKHVGLSVGRGSWTTDWVRKNRKMKNNADGKEKSIEEDDSEIRGPKWVRGDFYFKNRVVFSQWFSRLRPLLVKTALHSDQHVDVLYHGEKYLQEMTTKLRKNDADAMRLTSRLASIKTMNQKTNQKTNAKNIKKNAIGAVITQLNNDQNLQEELRGCEKIRDTIRIKMKETMESMIHASNNWNGNVDTEEKNIYTSNLIEWSTRLEKKVVLHTGRTFDLTLNEMNGTTGLNPGNQKKNLTQVNNITLERAVHISPWEGSLRWGHMSRTSSRLAIQKDSSATAQSIEAVAEMSWKACQQDYILSKKDDTGTAVSNVTATLSSAITAMMAHLQLLKSMEER